MLESCGAPASVIKKRRDRLAKNKANEEFELWDENVESFLCFIDLTTQFNISVGATAIFYTGLSYPAVESYFNMRQSICRDRIESLFDDIRELETGYLKAINSKKD